jgi:hypothetical protein
MTESFVVSPDSSTAYVAVPTAAVNGQSPGLVGVVSLVTGAFAGQAPVPSVHYLAINNAGSLLLGFMDNSDSVAVITPSQIGIGNPVTYIGGQGIFDRPIAAFFSSDDSTAYVVSCGAECGGMQAGVQQYNLVTNQLVASVPACIPNPGSNPITCQGPAAGSVALLNGSTMYLAGTPYSPGGGESLLCPPGTTQAEYCGQLTIVNLTTMSVTNTSEIIITDGYPQTESRSQPTDSSSSAHTPAPKLFHPFRRPQEPRPVVAFPSTTRWPTPWATLRPEASSFLP